MKTINTKSTNALGQRLEAARNSLGLSLEAVSQRTGLGISTISELENGKREPSISQLSALAKAYSRSLSYFFDENPVPDPIVLWRKRPEDEVAGALEATFRKLCEQYQQIEAWCGESVKSILPRCDVDAQAFDFSDVDALAHRVRQELNLGEYPAHSLFSTLETTCGIKIFHDTFEPTGTAACVSSDLYGKAILLNKGNISYRRNFDLAHELFHLLTWAGFRTIHADNGALASEQEEKLANRFASSLLVPDETLRVAMARRLDAQGNYSPAMLPALAEQFGVSIDALMWRIHVVYNLGPSREEETRQIIQTVKGAEDPRVKKEETREAPPKYPKRYTTLAIQALVTGRISTGKFCEYTGWTRREAMNLMSSEVAALGKVQITAA